MIEIYLKYDNIHIFGIVNAFNCINNNVISCINRMLSVVEMIKGSNMGTCKGTSSGASKVVYLP